MRGLCVLAVLPLSSAACVAGVALAQSSTPNVLDPKDIIADHIRQQGYKCDSPQSAKRDPDASRPDEEVWLVTCEDASYRVRLVPDLAAKVEPIDQSQSQDQNQ